MDLLQTKKQNVEKVKTILQTHPIEPAEINDYLVSVQSSTLVARQKSAQILLRPGIDLKSMVASVNSLKEQLSIFDSDTLLSEATGVLDWLES